MVVLSKPSSGKRDDEQIGTTHAIPMYLTCADCMANTRVERLHPTVEPALIGYCPMCASKNVSVKISFDKDYWYLMARHGSLVPSELTAKLVKDLYTIWDPLEYPKFTDYIRYAIKTSA